MSWEEWGGILAQQRADAAEEEQRRRDPVTCPEHRTTLEEGPNGERHCLFGGHVVHPM